MRWLAGCAALVLWAGAVAAASDIPAACYDRIAGAEYSLETDRYPHGALGDPFEYAQLDVTIGLAPGCGADRLTVQLRLPGNMVFEDVTPLLADLDGDGRPEILSVESHADRGARVAVYGLRDGTVSRIAATPYIGTRNRWLAQLGAADLDGDGHVEIAYIDRPHLAKTLRIWRFRAGQLEPVADLPGLTNHRFGEPHISGGIRECGQGPEIVTADAGWRQLAITRYEADRYVTRLVGPYSAQAMARALGCR